MNPRHQSPTLLAALVFSLPLVAAEPVAEPAAAPTVDRFAVLEYRVLGNSVLDPRSIERAVYPHSGPDKSITDIEAARLALETAYRDRGFGTVYVDIPEQTVDSGIVRLKVTEGRLRRVSVEGAKYVSGRRLVAKLPAAEAGRAPELPALQSQLALLNAETRDVAVTPVLGAGPVPGTVDLRLQVADTLPLHASLEVTDRFTADTERLRVTASVSYDNLFDRLHSIGLQYQTAPQEPDQVGVLAASYTARIGERSDRLAFTYISSDTNIAALGTLAVLGKGQIYQMRWTRTLANTAASTHSLSAGLDYKDFEENIRLDEEESFTTPISYANATLAYSGVWRAERTLWQLGSSVGFGPRPFNGEQEFADRRFRGRPNYFYLRSDAAARLALPWNFSARVSFAGQYAVEPLIPNEQFAVGGQDGVRGYLEAEVLNDIGFRSSLELGLPPLRFGPVLTLNTFLFGDAGRVASIRPLPEEDRGRNLRSYGAGLSFQARGGISGVVMWAHPLLDGNRTKAGEDRLHFSLRSAW